MENRLFGGSSVSDKRAKKDIKLKGKSPSGINIYSFRYIDPIHAIHGEGIYQGAMSNEVPPDVVSINSDNYEMIDYSKIDVEFKKIG